MEVGVIQWPLDEYLIAGQRFLQPYFFAASLDSIRAYLTQAYRLSTEHAMVVCIRGIVCTLPELQKIAFPVQRHPNWNARERQMLA